MSAREVAEPAPARTGFGFPKSVRLLKHSDFDRVYRQGRRYALPNMAMFYLRREGDRWITELVQGRDATLRLSSVDLPIAMAELYEALDFDADNAA